MDKTIVVTGANGFIGRYLIEYFSKRNYKVIALIHRAYKAALPGVDYRLFELDSFAGDVIPENTIAVIHAAYIPYRKGNNSDERNLRATKRLLEFSRKKNVGKFVFLSSFSAMPDALSHYGQSKYRQEQLFDISKDLILRPALVRGEGGLFRNIEKVIEKSGIIPLPGGGKQPVQLVDIDVLAKVIESSIEKNISGEYNIASGKPITVKELYLDIANTLNRKIRFVNIPFALILPAVNLLSLFTENLPVTKENILGLKQMAVRQPAGLKTVFGID
jgi:nucleoside-diphosphate-sugar epimerase